MYRGWDYQKSGEQRLTLSKGRTPQGLEYCMMQATMSTTTADGRYQLEDGAALVINAGAPIVIIGVRHNSSMFAHDRCSKYEGWPRFFASFTVKNAMPPTNTDEDASKRIIGRWAMSESRASGEYIFAANGHYQLTGAIGTSYTTSEHDYDVIHTTTSAFQGDGSYSVSGNRLTMRRRADRNPEEVSFRFEKVNRAGLGWKDHRRQAWRPSRTCVDGGWGSAHGRRCTARARAEGFMPLGASDDVIEIAPDGWLEAGNLIGEYRVRVDEPQRWTVRAVRRRGIRVANDRLVIRNAEILDELEILIGPR